MVLIDILNKIKGLLSIKMPKPNPIVTGVPVLVNNAVCFISGAAIDADGAHTAYAPKGSGLAPLDWLGNAGTPAEYEPTTGKLIKPANWYGVITDTGKKDGKPITQGPNDPSPGYYVSPTALSDPHKKETDPLRYVNSSDIAYIAIPPELKNMGVHLGDVCMVFYGSYLCGAIVADIGPSHKFGELSIKGAENLGIPSSPKNGGVSSKVKYVIFAGSSKGWPRDMQSIQDQAIGLYKIWGGSDKLEEVFG